ncbi:hypothetical protein MMC09_001813 [Bachmanniomyces sp. S44760]|nr:hypothetical protein [Bachmanniomyces sp. S44760]
MEELKQTPHPVRNQLFTFASPWGIGQIPWNPARCNRLLRPLSSRIALLRKHREWRPHTANEASVSAPEDFGNADCNSRKNVVERSVGKTFYESIEANDVDLEWTAVPGPRKRMRRTYSSKAAQDVQLGSGASKNCVSFQGHGKSSAIGRDKKRRTQSTASQLSVVLSHLSQHELLGSGGGQVNATNIKPDCKTGGAASRSELRQVARRWQRDDSMLIDGLYNALRALLSSTKSSQKEPIFGARTLFSTCLKRVPDYIAEECSWNEDEVSGKDVDVGSAIYDDLETYGSTSKHGWKPLRAIVRAHGISLVGNAIQDGLIHHQIAPFLIEASLAEGSTSEARCLILSMLISAMASETSLPDSDDDNSHITVTLDVLRRYACKTGDWGCVYRLLAYTVQHDFLNSSWVSSPDTARRYWKHAVQSVASQDEYAHDAALLLQALIFHAEGVDYERIQCISHSRRLQPSDRTTRSKTRLEQGDNIIRIDRKRGVDPSPSTNDASRNTASKVLVAIAAVCMSTSTSSDVGTRENIVPISNFLAELSTLSVLYHDLSSNDRSCRMATEPESRLWVPLFIQFLVTLMIDGTDSNAATMNEHLKNVIVTCSEHDTVATCMETILCAVAATESYITSGDTFAILQRVLKRSSVWLKDCSDNANLQRKFGSVITGAAFDFADRSKDSVHLDWALEVEDDITAMCVQHHEEGSFWTPARKLEDKASVFRWDDGIAEWVAKTPSVLRHRPEESTRDEDRYSTPNLEIPVYGVDPLALRVQSQPQSLSEISPTKSLSERNEIDGGMKSFQRKKRPAVTKAFRKASILSSAVDKAGFLRFIEPPQDKPAAIDIWEDSDQDQDVDELSMVIDAYQDPDHSFGQILQDVQHPLQRTSSIVDRANREAGCVKSHHESLKKQATLAAIVDDGGRSSDDELGIP